MPSVLAIFAHPDDIEFMAAGTMLMLQQEGWDLHYFNLCSGNGGSVQFDGATTAKMRLHEAQSAAKILRAAFYPPLCSDLELSYNTDLLRQVLAVVREAKPSIVLTHSPVDYMEDHMVASRLAVTAAFSRGIANFTSEPPREACQGDVSVYHALPHGLRDPLRRKVSAGAYVNTAPVFGGKRQALTQHESQQHWLDVTQGMSSYLLSMEEMSREVGHMSGYFEHAEGWRRHLHLGLSATERDPLKEALGSDCLIDVDYEKTLDDAVPV